MRLRALPAVSIATLLVVFALSAVPAGAAAPPPLVCSVGELTDLGANTTISPGRALDADGNKVAFLSDADPLGTNADRNNEVWLLDVPSGALTQVTVSSGASVNSTPAISDSGTLLTFTSTRNFGLRNWDGNREVWVFNSQTGSLTNLTNSTGGGSSAHIFADISGNGQVVTYLSTLNPLGTNADGNTELFTHQRTTGVRNQITHSTTGTVLAPSLSDNGALIAFASDRNLAGDNDDLNQELFVFDVTLQKLFQRTDSVGADGVQGQVDISGTGGVIVFTADADLTGGNPDQNVEVFRLTPTGSALELTQTTGVPQAGFGNLSPSTSDGGARTSFISGFNLTGQNPDGGPMPFVQDVPGDLLQLVQFPPFVAALATAVDDTGDHVVFRVVPTMDGSPIPPTELFIATCTP